MDGGTEEMRSNSCGQNKNKNGDTKNLVDSAHILHIYTMHGIVMRAILHAMMIAVAAPVLAGRRMGRWDRS